MSYEIDITKLTVYEEVRANRGLVNEFLAHKGFEYWDKLAEAVIDSKRHLALYDLDPRIREEARTTMLAFEQFRGLRLALAWALDGNAESAPGIPPATEDAKQEG